MLCFFFFLMIRRPPRSTQGVSSAASDVYKRQVSTQSTWEIIYLQLFIQQIILQVVNKLKQYRNFFEELLVMNKYGKYKDLFYKELRNEQIQIDAKMSEHIYFKVGGMVDILLTPSNIRQVKKSIQICKENNIPFYVIGNGSNLLVKDGGIRGVVIKLSEINNINIEGCKITAECGALLKDVSNVAAKNSLTGFEFASGIPGSVGGAVFMNAGAYDGEISFIIDKVEVLNDKEEIVTLNKEELELGYRPVSYTHLRAHETSLHLVCRLLLEKKKKKQKRKINSPHIPKNIKNTIYITQQDT
eukprot:TRINITY_DN125_c0_g1_i6.p3 TRINITY_DN125_c0_g1~~TRINITY_DN125_c0_g1_i6.p3  ORF type:complete len:301 (+),score=63.49 TRINITY_DN125_c0_g1_i6:95-997(+)